MKPIKTLKRFPGFPNKNIPGGPSINTRMIRDNYKRYQIAENETTRMALRYIARNAQLPMRTRLEAQLQLDAMPSCTRAVQSNSRCVLTGYGRGILNDFRMCPTKFRQYAYEGKLPGVTKASW